MRINIKGFDNIIFDLGGVILDLEVQSTIDAFGRLGLKRQIFGDKNDYSDPIFHKFQKGEVSVDQFRNWVRKMAVNNEVSDNQIDEAWYGMLAGIPFRRVAKIKELRNEKKVFLFSNTNEIHIEYLENWFLKEYGFPFDRVFDGIAYSHQIKDAKPAESSFRTVIEIFQIVPTKTLFVDDIEENVLGAKKAGLETLYLLPGIDIADIF